MTEDRLKYLKHVIEVQKSSTAVVMRQSDAEWAANEIELLTKVRAGQAAMISQLVKDQEKHWKESLCIESLLRKKLSSGELKSFISELDALLETEIKCPTCQNEQIYPGQEFCQICGRPLKVR